MRALRVEAHDPSCPLTVHEEADVPLVLRRANLSGTMSGMATGSSGVATVVQVISSVAAVTLAEDSGGREGLIIHNASTGILYVKFGTGASLTSYSVKVAPDGMYEMPENIYGGIITGIWSLANGFAYVTQQSS
ncbi:MAG: hypothetical protein H0U53_11115 [Actinobacteria bacterium]|nr:hypothetical protein [Actinomycetota bacterium]